MLRAMRSFLKDNDMMAYLTHIAVRLVELHRVLKPTGSIYLHCDPTASHYLKVLMDAVFGKEGYRGIIYVAYRPRTLREANSVKHFVMCGGNCCVFRNAPESA
jgi:site-specific DNA-methyltransferase (adenine-specific)